MLERNGPAVEPGAGQMGNVGLKYADPPGIAPGGAAPAGRGSPSVELRAEPANSCWRLLRDSRGAITLVRVKPGGGDRCCYCPERS